MAKQLTPEFETLCHDEATTHYLGTKKRCKRHATVVGLTAWDHKPIAIGIIPWQHLYLALAGKPATHSPVETQFIKALQKALGNTKILKDLLWKFRRFLLNPYVSRASSSQSPLLVLNQMQEKDSHLLQLFPAKVLPEPISTSTAPPSSQARDSPARWWETIGSSLRSILVQMKATSQGKLQKLVGFSFPPLQKCFVSIH